MTAEIISLKTRKPLSLTPEQTQILKDLEDLREKRLAFGDSLLKSAEASLSENRAEFELLLGIPSDDEMFEALKHRVLDLVHEKYIVAVFDRHEEILKSFPVKSGRASSV